MKQTYVIPTIVKDDLQKRLENLNKKAQSYGNKIEWSFTDEVAITRNIFEQENGKTVKIGEEKVFGIGVTIDSDIIRKDGYTIVAGIEHQNSGNIVNSYVDDYPIDTNWYTMPPYCEHCKTRHAKKYSYIVREDNTGICKQVGKACLRDYSGIDPQMIVYAMEISDLIVNEYNIDHFDFSGSGEYAYKVLDAIALASDIIREFGYVKSCEPNSTKSILIERIGSNKPSEEGMKLATEMQSEISKMDYYELSDFLRNVKSMIQSQYVRLNVMGFIAYAPLAYKKMKQQKELELHQEEMKKQSNHIGNIGDRIAVDIKEIKLITNYETLYGWTYIYRFTNFEDNVFVWFSSKYIEGTPVRIIGTVKNHNEYNGEKQTVLTRCKVIGG